jgi:hypothetical protein
VNGAAVDRAPRTLLQKVDEIIADLFRARAQLVRDGWQQNCVGGIVFTTSSGFLV